MIKMVIILKQEIILGTRDSQLAVWQTKWVLERLRKLNPDKKFSLKYIKTQGDKILDVALSKIGDKGLFTKELEIALLNKEIDLAVHSMKDLPTKLPEGLKIGCITERENPQDVIISYKGYSLKALPKGSRIGTSSLRRKAQLLHFRKDLVIEDIRGNLQTRLKKMVDNNLSGIILAAAGVLRLGWKDKITEYIPMEISLPAVGQGSLGIEIRENDNKTETLVRQLHHDVSGYCINAERSLLAYLEGGCQIPIGAYGTIQDNMLVLEAMVADLQGKKLLRDKAVGKVTDYKTLGIELAKKLLDKGAGEILKTVVQEIDTNEN
jgi:hydroxymethylbilane synthase